MKVKIKIELEVSTDRDFKSPVLQKKLKQAIIRGATSIRHTVEDEIDYHLGSMENRLSINSKELSTLEAMRIKVSKPVATAK
jgi:hypothetical protein